MKKHSILTVLLLVALSIPLCAQENTKDVLGSERAGTIVDPSILSYSSVKDIYTGRIAARNLAIQVDVENGDSRPLWVKGLTAGFDPTNCDRAKELYAQFNVTKCRQLYDRIVRYPSANAPVDQRQLIAVAQVGQIQSRRATIFRYLEFGLTLGTAAAPYLNASQASGIATLSGVGLPALQRLFPDLSSQQIQQLSDHSYRQGIIVASKQSESFVIFIPSDRIFDKESWKLYTASAQEQSAEALEIKQILQMLLTVSLRADYIIAVPAPEATSDSLIRRRQ
jgi:hypothetical protein